MKIVILGSGWEPCTAVTCGSFKVRRPWFLGMVMPAEVLKETGCATRAENVGIMKGFSSFSMEWVNITLMHDAETKS